VLTALPAPQIASQWHKFREAMGEKAEGRTGGKQKDGKRGNGRGWKNEREETRERELAERT